MKTYATLNHPTAISEIEIAEYGINRPPEYPSHSSNTKYFY